MNSVCERFLGSVRRECLDHVMILGEAHLQHVLAEYAPSYFNTARPHQGIGQQIPVSGERHRSRFTGSVTAIPVLSGLHHDISRGGMTAADVARSHDSHFRRNSERYQWAQQGSNLRLRPCEGRTLPLSYAPLSLGSPTATAIARR
jgi:integrase-like protein